MSIHLPTPSSNLSSIMPLPQRGREQDHRWPFITCDGVDAFRQYRLVEAKALITTPIEMCALVNNQNADNDTAITTIASYLSALKEIDNRKNSFDPKEFEIP